MKGIFLLNSLYLNCLAGAKIQQICLNMHFEWIKCVKILDKMHEYVCFSWNEGIKKTQT